MLKGFKKFVNEYSGTYNSQDSTYTQTQDYVPQVSQEFNSAFSGKLKDLVKAMSYLDPFFNKRRGANISGSIDYMPPEIARGNSKHEDDNLTHFYISVNKNHPQIANYMRPMMGLFKNFHNSILTAIDQALQKNHFENVEMAHRLDVRSAQEIKKAVENVRLSLSKFTAQELQQLGNQFAQAVRQFQQFYSEFNKNFPHVERHLEDAHAKVKHLAWDQSRNN